MDGSDDANVAKPFSGAGKRRESNNSIRDERDFEFRVSRGDTQRGTRQDSDDDHHAPDSPPSKPYDPPIGHHESDIALQQVDEPHSYDSGYLRSPDILKGEYASIAGGTLRDDSDQQSLLQSGKKYDHRETRLFLLKTGFYRFAITFMFCALIALSLKSYQGFEKPRVIGKPSVRLFNSIMIGLSLGLGLNLASSLKRYGVILRWSLLSKRYISLETFDLILGLETLTKVGKLMIISLPGIKKIKFLRTWPWFRDARDDGTRLTWIACLLWIFINIGAQVLVASLSLFWPVDPSNAFPLMTTGSVMTSDLTRWAADSLNKPERNVTTMESAWFYGNEAAGYPIFNANETMQDLTTLSGPPYYRLNGSGHFEYRFVNRNPEHQFTQYKVTSRKIEVKATCTQLEVYEDAKQGKGDESDEWIILGRPKGVQSNWTKYSMPSITTGSITWIGAYHEFCGPRCTNYTVYQDNDNIDIRVPALFLCNNTFSEVTGGEKDYTNLTPQDRDALYGADKIPNNQFFRIGAGAMAWTGYIEDDWDERQARSYTRGSKWSPYHEIKTNEVEDLLARFSIGAIAAFDDHGMRYTVANQRSRPVQGQIVSVDWLWILTLLGAICVIQLGALIALILFANKSIIRDESFFSLAMLLRPVVNRIGEEGMNLTGDEIKKHRKLQWKRIRYDYKDGDKGTPNHVTIHIQGRDTWESRRSWTPGYYN
ncbi:hypothetical protein B0J11DRAFT_137323 [Dendryphion nanum]|uniref:Uncharacterized protein n=1 Tax=Dendryphion nanum TaxID=256645 RepID=A0A9P9D8N8_9PLEO|nr:hypothetical protein B0J11DRAFT_137323 [Dendryphion nanum]